MSEFERRFGKTDAGSVLRFVFSPRDGWGYSRLPMIVVSEKQALEQAGQPFGKELMLQGDVHETAHFWWGIADVTTCEDWINEGLAEYSAFSFMAATYGPEYRDHELGEYVKDVRNVTTATSIIATEGNSRERYVNRYEKTALLFYVLNEKAGSEALDEFLAELYAKFKGTREATTATFLDLARKHFKAADCEFLEGYLTSPGWSAEQLKTLAEVGVFSIDSTSTAYFQDRMTNLLHGPDMDLKPETIPPHNITVAGGVLERWGKLFPESDSLKFNLGWHSFLTRDYKSAIRLLSPLADKINAGSVADQFIQISVFRTLGFCYDLIGQRDKAVDCYTRCEQLLSGSKYEGLKEVLLKDYKKSPYKRPPVKQP